MARILFAVIPERGHLHPYLGAARSLVRAGHEVAFYAAHDIGPLLAELGFARFYAGGPHPPADENRGAVFAERVRDPAWLRAWISSLLVDGVPAQIAPFERAVDDFAPDALALDPMVYQAVLVATERKIPWAALSSSLNPVVPSSMQSELQSTVRALAPARDALFTARGLAPPRFSVCDALSPHEGATVVFATEALVGEAPTGVTLAGPALPHGKRAADEERVALPLAWEHFQGPRVYMSLGSQLFHQPAMFSLAIEACARIRASLLCAAGELASDPLFSRAPHVHAVPFAPQLRALERAHAAITHGGANSVMECCAADVPLLVTPVCNDQPHNAHYVSACGNGLALDLAHATVAQLAEALTQLTDRSGPYARRARAVAESYKRDGSQTAADVLVRLAGR